MKARGKAEVIQVNLRLPQDLRRRLMREAKKGRRSLNTEMIARLEHSFERDDADELLKSAQEQYLGVHKTLRHRSRATKPAQTAHRVRRVRSDRSGGRSDRPGRQNKKAQAGGRKMRGTITKRGKNTWQLKYDLRRDHASVGSVTRR